MISILRGSGSKNRERKSYSCSERQSLSAHQAAKPPPTTTCLWVVGYLPHYLPLKLLVAFESLPYYGRLCGLLPPLAERLTVYACSYRSALIPGFCISGTGRTGPSHAATTTTHAIANCEPVACGNAGWRRSSAWATRTSFAFA